MKAMRFVVLTAAATWSKKALKRDTIASSPSPGGHLTIEASVYVPLAAQAQAESEALLCPSRPNRLKVWRPKKAEREGKQWYKYTMKADGNWFQCATSPHAARTYTNDVRNTWRLITPCVLYSLAEEVVLLLAASIAYGDHRQMWSGWLALYLR